MKRLFVAVLLVVSSLFVFSLPAGAAEVPLQAQVKTGAVNVNVATTRELQKLPGVGQVTAERIVAFRDANGPFASVDALIKVQGIGRKTLEKIRPLVVVE
ncbi:ComEA family DNA-binding protein [Geothermobacter hydrogeniphilus]|nr:helix-hairpin-helix domain-containing protein [Geothermobacter hydrogeniphilus]